MDDWRSLHHAWDVWLVVSTPLKNISQLGWLFPIYGIYGKIKMFQTTNQMFYIPSSNSTVCYWAWPHKFLVFSSGMVIFHSYVNSPKGILLSPCLNNLAPSISKKNILSSVINSRQALSLDKAKHSKLNFRVPKMQSLWPKLPAVSTNKTPFMNLYILVDLQLHFTCLCLYGDSFFHG